MQFSEDIIKLLEEKFPGKDIYSMSLEELKSFKEELTMLRQEYSLLELGTKTLANAAYGSSANAYFYFYNVALAADITGECRNLTKTMNDKFIKWFHEDIWERKDLWEKFDFELDESKHDWYREQAVWIYSDTDSSYVTYGAFFQAMTPKYQEKYKTNEAKLDWILKYNEEFQNEQNTKWCEEIYNPRHGNNVHNFELETVALSQIILAKKKYIKGLIFNKGKKLLDKPKVSGTGIEIIKSTTPKLCRKILTELTRSLMFDFDDSTPEKREEYIMFFNNKLTEYRKEFYNAPIEDISQSVGVGNYKKYVIEDTNQLILGKQCPVSVQSVARFNYLAHKNNDDSKKFYSGKIKYYNIRTGMKKDDIGYFGFPAGELPEWAPKIDKLIQWEKTVIDPINRFLEVMKIPLVNASNVIQLELF